MKSLDPRMSRTVQTAVQGLATGVELEDQKHFQGDHEAQRLEVQNAV